MDFGTRLFWLLVALLVGLSTYFGVNAEHRRRATQRGTDVAVADGDSLRVVRVVDGDTVMANTDGGDPVVVRLVGVKVLTAEGDKDPATHYARLAAEALGTLLAERRARADVDPALRDRRGRLLATLTVDGMDPAIALLERGLALAYRAYPFEREAEYTEAERRARLAQVGLWAHPELRRRAEAMTRLWQERRQ